MIIRKFSAMLWLGLAATTASSLGCTICNTAHMWDYGGAGGKWQRGNPTCGRVGSILSDAGEANYGPEYGEHQTYGDSWGLMDGTSTMSEDEFFEDGDSSSYPRPPSSTPSYAPQLAPNLNAAPENESPQPGSIMIGS